MAVDFQDQKCKRSQSNFTSKIVSLWDLDPRFSRASPRRPDTNTATTLTENVVGRARMGSAERRWTGEGLHRVPREGDVCHGQDRRFARRTGTARFGAPGLEQHDADNGRLISGIDRRGGG